MYETSESAPNGVPQLSPAQMAEDFDYLVKITNEVCPAHHLNKAIYGIDFSETLERHRAMLPTISTTDDFIRLLDRTVNACHASHFCVTTVTKEMMEQWGQYYPGITEKAIELSKHYFFSVIRRTGGWIKFDPLLFYLDGNYYLKHDFVWQGRAYPAGLRITHCNGQPVDEATADLVDRNLFAEWDYRRRRFYHPHFIGLIAHDLPEVRLRFEGRDEESIFPVGAAIEVCKPTHDRKPAVRYYTEHQMLYVRIPVMNIDDIPFYREGITREAQRGKVERVVLDIRDNGGGSDWVWSAVLTMVLPQEKVSWQGAAIMRNTEMTRNHYEKVLGAQALSQWEPRRIPVLDNEEFLWQSEPHQIARAPEAIEFSGPLFVLSDYIYSAAGSLCTLATKSNCMTTVGRRNPHILGMGINPFIFTLPHSQALISVEPILDLTNAEKIEDILHTEVNVEVQPTVQEMLDYCNSSLDPLSPEFLFEHDPFMRKALEPGILIG